MSDKVIGTISVSEVKGTISVSEVTGAISVTEVGGSITYQGAFIPSVPTVTTTSISNITDTTADSGGNVTDDGGVTVIARGVCWSTSQNPTTADSKTTNGTGTGIFTSEITGLSPGTTYYVRAYATNEAGTGYGSEVEFSALAVAPTVTTADISDITGTTADGGGNVTDDGGGTVTVRGVCWSTSESPTIADDKTEDGSGTGSFTSELTGLIAETTYYVRAYATNEISTAYGTQKSFETTSIYCAEFQAVYDSWTTKPTDADAAELNTKVEKMIADGVWAEYDVYYNFAVHTNDDGEAQVNWKNPGTFDATLMNNPAFVAFEGFTGDGATQCINTNWKANPNAINYILADAFVCGYTRTDNTHGNLFFGTGNLVYMFPTTGVNSSFRINTGVSTNVAKPANASGMWLITRLTGSNNQILYHNKIALTTQAMAPSVLSNSYMGILCQYASGSPGSFSNRQVSMFAVGGGLTQTNVDDMTDAFEAWMDYKGKGVIP